MEDVENKKMADEKYCSDCGKIIKIKAEICPYCGVRQVPISDVIKNSTPEDKKLLSKFLYSGGITLGIFVVLILAVTPQDQWVNGIIGSFIFGLFSAVIAMLIPSSKKLIYIPISLTIVIFIAGIIGMSQN